MKSITSKWRYNQETVSTLRKLRTIHCIIYIYILGQCIKCNEPKCTGYTEKGVKCDFLLTLDKDVDNTCCKTQNIIPHPVHITSIVWSVHMKKCQSCFTFWYKHLNTVLECSIYSQAVAIFRCYCLACTYKYKFWTSKGAVNVVGPTKSYVAPFIDWWRIWWFLGERRYCFCNSYYINILLDG